MSIPEICREKSMTHEPVRDRKSAHLSQAVVKYVHCGSISAAAEDVPKRKEAAGNGDARAMYCLGRLVLQGREVPKDKEEALRWLESSAAQGNIYAQYLTDRVDGERDPSILLAAVKLLQKRRALGH